VLMLFCTMLKRTLYSIFDYRLGHLFCKNHVTKNVQDVCKTIFVISHSRNRTLKMATKRKFAIDPSNLAFPWILDEEHHLLVMKEKEGGTFMCDMGALNGKMAYTSKGEVGGLVDQHFVTLGIKGIHMQYQMHLSKFMNLEATANKLKVALVAKKTMKQLASKFYYVIRIT
jgi:hypothetical protein